MIYAPTTLAKYEAGLRPELGDMLRPRHPKKSPRRNARVRIHEARMCCTLSRCPGELSDR